MFSSYMETTGRTDVELLRSAAKLRYSTWKDNPSSTRISVTVPLESFSKIKHEKIVFDSRRQALMIKVQTT